MIWNFIWSRVTVSNTWKTMFTYFFTSLWLVYFISGSLYLLMPLPTSSSPQPPPSWQPPACHGDLHLNHTLLSLTQRYLIVLQTTWSPEIWLAPRVFQAINTGVYTVWWWHDCKLKNVDLDHGFPNAALFRVLQMQSAPYRSTLASLRLLEFSVPISWGSWKGRDRLSAYNQYHLELPISSNI